MQVLTVILYLGCHKIDFTLLLPCSFQAQATAESQSMLRSPKLSMFLINVFDKIFLMKCLSKCGMRFAGSLRPGDAAMIVIKQINPAMQTSSLMELEHERKLQKPHRNVII